LKHRILPLLCAAASLTAASNPHRESRQIMGTLCEIQVYDSDAARAQSAIRAALDEMSRVDHLLSNYDPASELSVMNREAARGPFLASTELFAFVTACRRFYDLSEGTFDPTVGALVRAWGFFSRNPGMPSPAAIVAAKAASGFDRVRMDPAARTIQYAVAGIEMDPGGIGKGYAVDQAVAVLKARHIRAALVSAGGSTLYGLGHPPDKPAWRVAIANPANSTKAIAFVELRDNSLSTSGVSEQSLLAGSHRYSHIFDPRTGEPVENMCQVTVVAHSGAVTDALCKPAFILSRGGVIEVLKRYSGAHALRLEGRCNAGETWVTPWSPRVFESAR